MLPTRHSPLLALDQTIVRLESALFVPHGDDSGYDLHSLPMPEFLAGLDVCGTPGRFVDLGCGIGTKLLVAHLLGWDVAGVERQADYVATARRLVPEAEVVHGDVSTIDLRAFDVVYSYRLRVDLEEQRQLNAQIIGRMRSGALFFCAGSEPPEGEYLGCSVWRV